MDKLQRVSYIHPKYIALQYPLFFPNVEDLYHNKIPFRHADPNVMKYGDMISMKDYYFYKFQVRDNEGMSFSQCNCGHLHVYMNKNHHNSPVIIVLYLIEFFLSEMTARLGGHLFQQYMVDAFFAIEQTHWWFRKN